MASRHSFGHGMAPAADPNTLGCFVLCPFSNRISGGGFEAGNRFWPLAPNLADEPYPIHGDAWQKRWRVVETSETALDLVLESGSMPPFAYRAQLRYDLDDRALRSTPHRPASRPGDGTLRPRLSPMAAADACHDAASGRRSCVARATGPPAGSLCADRRAPGMGLPSAAAAAGLVDQQRLRRLERSGANRLAGARVSGSRSRRATRSEPMSSTRRAPRPTSSASSQSRTRSMHSTCRAGLRRTV